MKMIIRTLPFFLLLFVVSFCSADEIYSKNRKANELYKKGKFDEALKLYEDALLLSPSDEKLKMNQGSSLYKLGDFDKAEESYNGALSVKDKKIRSDAHYNMGNILFKKAEQIQQQDLQSAQEKYKSALQHYIESLNLSPDNIDAKWNLQLAHEKIKQLQQQQQQQQQNKDDKNKNDNKNDQNKQQQNNDQKKDQQNSQDKKENQNDDKQQDKQQQDKQQQDQQDQQQQQQQQSEMKEAEDQKDMKKEDARRLIELYADDADSLNKPSKKNAQPRQPQQDW